MSSLKFGTSGLRGLVVDLAGAPARRYAGAFLKHLAAGGEAAPAVLVGRDLRPSSPGIAADCAAAARATGVEPVDCGALPTPALALAALERGLPAIMVTGSHIPDDRNGLKFYRAGGEIAKADESGILEAHAALSPDFGAGRPEDADALRGEDLGEAVRRAYLARYLDFFGPAALEGLAIGVYEHSSVARDILPEILEALGARVARLGRAARFVPVDTEAHRPEDRALVAGWTADGRFDAVVSTDGDADRPLVSDERGRFLRGDVLGLLTARHLGAKLVATPVTSASAIERVMGESGAEVRRTRVGSPFVLEAMAEGAAGAAGPVVGFEANGGLLLGTPAKARGRRLAALPTRDAVLPIVAALREAKDRSLSLSALVESLSAGFTAADRLTDVPAEASARFLSRLAGDRAFAARLLGESRAIAALDRTDGVRLALGDGRVVHFRASGNAPELRCYVEAETQSAADAELARSLDAARQAVGDADRPAG